MHFGVGKDSPEREKSEGEERPWIHCQRENSPAVGHTSVLKLRPTQGTERTTCYCFFPVPVPAGPLPGEGGETGEGVQGRRPFALHRAEVYRRYRCCRFRSGLTRFRYTAWFVSCGYRLLRVSLPAKKRAPESGLKSLESSGRMGKKARNLNTI